MKKKIRIMHIRDSSGIFGAERVILTLAKNIDQTEFKIGLICFRRGDGRSERLINMAKVLGVEVFPIDVRGKLDIRSLFMIRRILLLKKIDIIHTHDFKSDFYGLISTLRTSMARVSTAHGSTRDSLLKRIYLLFTEKGTYRFFHKVIAVSHDLKNYLLSCGLPIKKIETIQNGMDFSLLKIVAPVQETDLPDLKDQKVFSVIGRLFSDKGHRFFIEAFTMVRREFPNIAAMIVGDGPEKDAIIDQIKRLKLEKYVHICGIRDNIRDVYDRTDCLVIPSLTEGLPYVLLESMAMKVPIIASAVGDIPLLISHNDSGYLVTPGQISDLKNKMITFLKNHRKCLQMAEKAFEIVNHKYSAKSMTAKTEALYRQLIKN